MKKLEKRVMALHEKGSPMSEIAEELAITPEEVRSMVLGTWDEDKRKRSVAEKVAGRFGRGYFDKRPNRD